MTRIFTIFLLLASLVFAQGVYRSRRGLSRGTPNPQAYKGVAGSFHGMLKELTKKEIMIETEDEQTVSIHVSGKTKFLKGGQPIKPADIDLETPVTIDASEDAGLTLTAVSVTVGPPPK
jgi:hypothetical protein